MYNATLMHPKDDVATVTVPIARGDTVTLSRDGKDLTVTARTDIPQYHKIALRDIPFGASVHKYGEHIGFATAPISTGEHVHTQNLSSIAPQGGEGA